MPSIYEKPEVYDLFETESKYSATLKHWSVMLEGKRIHSMLDISIGTGGLTLPVAELGIELYGSDINENMLDRCREKAKGKNIKIDLRACDFRNLINNFDRKFDCVVSTGNSLTYVNNNELFRVLEEMDALINEGGYLCFDLRNWDKIIKNKQRFFVYNPVFVNDVRVNAVQVWDHHTDGSITFNILYSYEKDNKIIKKEVFEEHYYPVSYYALIDKLSDMGYDHIETRLLPAQFGEFDINSSDWYCLIAGKKNSSLERGLL